MAKRRELKKKVNYIASELFMECLVNKLYVPGTDPDKADKLLGKILDMQNDYLSRISHTEPGNAKNYYKKLQADFDTKVQEIIEALGKLS